jgi:hypothetical protein
MALALELLSGAAQLRVALAQAKYLAVADPTPEEAMRRLRLVLSHILLRLIRTIAVWANSSSI